MEGKSKNNREMDYAKSIIERVNKSKDPYIVYKYSRPITNLKDMLESSVKKYGDHVAFMQRVEKNQPFKKITYKEVLEDVNGLGTSLLQLGLQGKRIGIIGDNCYQWATAYLAAVCGTGVAVPLDKELSSRDLKQLVIEAELSAILFTEKFETIFQNMKDSGETKLEILVNLNGTAKEKDVFTWTSLVEKGKGLVKDGDKSFVDAEIDSDAMSVLLFTSGTTGISKGVMLSHKNICADLMLAPTILHVNSWDIFFSVLPIHHTYECTCGFLMPLYKGACIAYCEGLKHIQKNLQEIKPTMFLGVPLIFESLYKNIMKGIKKKGKENTVRKVMALNRITGKIGFNLNKRILKDVVNIFGGRMRVLISGGAAIDPKILEFFNELGFIAVQGYGLTECSPMVALNPDTYKTMRNESVGHVLPDLKVKVVDVDENGVGELCFKGNNVMMGYYNMPEETEKVLKDGWFHTGDLGYVDSEDFVYITGRKKNVIITKNGKNVFPEELEYLLGKIPYITESMVWADENNKGDTVVVATIKPDMEEIFGTLAEGADDEKTLENLLWEEIDKINESLPPFKRIKRINIKQGEFEKTTGKKIKRFVESNK